MNTNSALPDKLEGKWIWFPESAADSARECDYVLFRQEFSLFEMPGVAELWVASHCHFQLFINGRMATYGPIPHPGSGRAVYAVCVDITHLAETGINSIAVAVLKEKTALAGAKQSIDGIWMQVNIDGTPILASDESWLCTVPEYLKSTGLRAAPGDVFVEHADMEKMPHDWKKRPLNELEGQWTQPRIMGDVQSDYAQIEFFGQESAAFDFIQPLGLVCRGTFSQSCECTWISFANAISKRGELGLYVAETYIFSPPEQKLTGICVCDEPYVIFVNGAKVKKQAVPKLHVGGPLQNGARPALALHEMASSQDFEMHLQSGWNRVIFAQQCSSRNSGALLLWPDLPANGLRPTVKPSTSAQLGWQAAGPLNVPMALIYPSFPFDELVHVPCPADHMAINDIAAFYLSCLFRPDAVAESRTLPVPVELKRGEYFIVDFGKTYYAFPRIFINGGHGDIVDVVCGELCQDGEVISCELGVRRNTLTVTLDEGANDWMCASRKGARYLMIVARDVKDKVSINGIGMVQENMEYKTQGAFQSSSPVLDSVWNTGVKTLETTMRRIFLDSPTKGQAQSLPDAMIQAMASYYICGNYDMAGRAIENFARSQFETGEMNALSPSGLFQAVPDYSLCWPVWLYKHYQHTGDKDFLLRMIPALNKLLFYYNEMAVEPDGPLGELQDYLGILPFIDYGDMDRSGISTALNAFYCRALKSAAWLVGQAGMPDLESTYNNRATSVAKQVNQLTWNDAQGLFADSWKNGRQSKKFSWQSSLLAIYGGIAKPHYYDEIWDRLFMDEAPLERLSGGEYNNPYFKYFVLETAFALGKAPWALSLMHYYWGSMVKNGATTWWEMFDPMTPGQADRVCGKCHGYGVSPNSFIISDLVGIRPAEPGMHRVYFNPMPGDVSWVKASIPTPHGHITVHWKLYDDENFTVTINANYMLEVIPIMAPGLAKAVTFKVNDKVSILTPE